MSMKIGDKNANISKAERLVDECVRKHNANIVGLPEFFNTEYFPQWVDHKNFALAEPIPGPTTDRMIKKAVEHGIYICSPIYEEVEKGIYYDSSPVIGPDGRILGTTRKVEIPLIDWKGTKGMEKFYFRGGSEFPIFETKFGKLGQIICYNRHYPEEWRIYALKGADMIFVPVASMGQSGLSPMFPIETRASCFMNQLFAAVTNRIGIEGENNYYGASHIVDPLGVLLAGPASADHEGIISATMDLDMIREVRNGIPLWRDRRPEIYGPILKSEIP
jgi:N-carbamoylputrescine amidase